jgi:putative FmdB family regulatory protein
MPTYEFRCRTCDTVFEERRAMSASDLPAQCPDGHDDTVKLLSVFASVGGKQGSSVSGSDLASAMSTPRAGGGCGTTCGCH